MRVRCPNCSHPVELVNDQLFEGVSCPSCGSRFNFSGGEEDTITAMATSKIPALEYFQLLETVGTGQFGRVWKARDVELERMVAVKVPHSRNLSPEEAAFFVREASSAAQLQHPNIVTVFEVGREDDTVYIVSEYIEGLPLREWAKKYKPDAKQSARLCVQLARALNHAHEQHVVHRDFKPANIIIDGNGDPHITDFGLAKREGAEMTIAVTGQILGTPAYMAPEQVRDGHAADRRSDIYSLGVILYELLTGERPFTGGKRLLLHQVLHDEPRAPRSLNKRISRDLNTICLKAMAKKPEERYATGSELADDLERYLRDEPVLARRMPWPVRTLRWARRRPAITACVGLSVVILLLLPAFLLSLGPTPSPTARTVALDTRPPNANVVFIPLDDRNGAPHFERAIDAGQAPVKVKCEPGQYLVVAYLDDQMFHEVYRHVPAAHEELPGAYPHLAWIAEEGVICLPLVQLFETRRVAANMSRVDGGDFEMPSADLAGATDVQVPGFYVDVTEMTVGEVLNTKMTLPAEMPRPGPPADFPVNQVSWHEAVTYAERMGKRLLHEAEFQYLVTQGGTITDATGWEAAQAPAPEAVTSDTFDRLTWSQCDKPLIGMRSNVLEWTANWWAGSGLAQQQRVVRGGYFLAPPTPDDGIDLTMPPPRIVFYAPLAHPRLGFRCARSIRPTLAADNAVQLRVKEH